MIGVSDLAKIEAGSYDYRDDEFGVRSLIDAVAAMTANGTECVSTGSIGQTTMLSTYRVHSST